jgi:hypothetical protein
MIIAGYSPNGKELPLPHPMASNFKNDDEYQFARPRSTWKPNFAQIRGFLYFGGHFGFKMAAIKIQNGGRCHGNQGAKNVKFTPYSGTF